MEWYGDYELVLFYVDVWYYLIFIEWVFFFYGDLGYGLGFLDEVMDGGIMFGVGGGI